MHRTGGDDGARGVDESQFEQMVDVAALDVKALGALAELRVGPSQLFLQTTEQTRMALCISDPLQDDCPIVYCNQAFVDLTGFEREEIVGTNCRFLQGELTSASSVAKMRFAQENEDYTVVHVLNYKKDKTPFWNAVHIGPIYDETGKLAYFFGSQWDITELISAREQIIDTQRIANELRHRTDNLFAVLTAIVRLSARGASNVDELAQSIAARIEALASAHRSSLAGEDSGEGGFSLLSLVKEVVRPYQNSHPGHIELVGEDVHLPRRIVTPVGLTLHELATNAVKYGALAHNDGRLSIDWIQEGDMLEVHWIEKLSPKAYEDARISKVQGGGTGSRLIEGVIRGAKGSIETVIEPEGFRATIRIPNSPDKDIGDRVE